MKFYIWINTIKSGQQYVKTVDYIFSDFAKATLIYNLKNVGMKSSK